MTPWGPEQEWHVGFLTEVSEMLLRRNMVHKVYIYPTEVNI